MRKSLPFAVSTLGLTASLFFCALWVRSYSWRDNIYFGVPSTGSVGFASEEGKCAIFFIGTIDGTERNGIDLNPWRLRDVPGNRQFFPFDEPYTTLGFIAFWHAPNGWALIAPHWCLVVVFAILATAPWLRWRFSLRALLIGMTLVALFLGAIAVSS